MITPIQSKALWHISPTKTILKDNPITQNNNINSVWIQSQYSLVSIGTEVLVANGNVPNTLQQSM